MKRFLSISLTCLPLLCLGAPSISYTSYFNNTHTYTNAFVGGQVTVSNTLSATQTDLLLKEIRFRPTVPTGQGSWTINSGTGGTNDANGTYDEVSSWGFNYRPQGGKYDNSLHMLKFGLESNFLQSNLTNYWEWNIDFIDSTGTISRRPWSVAGALDTGLTYYGIAGPQIQFYGQTVGNPNPTIWNLVTNANQSTFAFNGLISATATGSFGTYSEAQSNLWWRTATFPFPSSNYERAYAVWNGTTFTIGTEANGSGSVRPIDIKVGSSTVLAFNATGTDITTSARNLTLGTTGGDSKLLGGSGVDLFATPASGRRFIVDTSAGSIMDVQGGTVRINRSSGALNLNANGANGTIGPGNSTLNTLWVGNGAVNSTFGGYIKWGATGITQIFGTNNTLVGQFGPTGDFSLTKTITAAGTTGNQTIDKASGSVNFAAAAQSITVTCAFSTVNSVIMATVATDDTTAKSCIAVPGAGSFVLKLNAAATAETRVNFLITN